MPVAETLRQPVEEPAPAPDHLRLVGGGLQSAELLLPHEVRVVELVSEGQTTNQIARQTGYSPPEVKGALHGAMRELGTHSTAVLVDRSVRLGIIAVELDPDPEILAQVTPTDRRMLGVYARGVSNHQIAKKNGTSLRAVEAYHDRLLERVGAWSRAHAIRRSYELEIRGITPLPPRALPRRNHPANQG